MGIALGAGVLYAIAAGYYAIRKEEGMGMGDVKMLAMIGAFLGWPAVVLTLMLSSFSGAIIGLAAHRVHARRRTVCTAVWHLPRARGARRHARWRRHPELVFRADVTTACEIEAPVAHSAFGASEASAADSG